MTIINITNVTFTGKRKKKYTVRGYKKPGRWKSDLYIYRDNLADAVKNNMADIVDNYEIRGNITSINLQNNNNSYPTASLIITSTHYKYGLTTMVIPIDYNDNGCPLPVEFTMGAANSNL